MSSAATAAIMAGALCLLLAAGAVGQDVTIADKGAARAVIVVAKDAPPPVRHAAAELAAFLKQVTGAAFDVAHQAGTDRPRLLVGPGAAKSADRGFSTQRLGAEGIVLRTVGKDVILAGGAPRGTLYAVYTFLEDVVGCRWWSSTASTIPGTTTLKVARLNVRYVPPLAYREPFWFVAFDGDWAVRNKCNGHAARLDARRGGRHVYEGFVHTFYSLIPPAKYFKDHPEWFGEVNGKRAHRHRQLCLANDAMRAELVKNLKARLSKNPSATIASVSQNDWHGYCQCKRCAAIDKQAGSPSGSLIRFVNAVAAEVEKDFPRVAISTLAYQYTRRPPKGVRPRDNVIVRLCSIECSFSRPLSHPANRLFARDLLAWSKICKRLYVWDYTTNFRHHVLPHPNLRVLGPNVKFFVAHNVKGVFEQGAYGTGGAEMAELRAWVLAKLLWKPDLNAQRLIDEFLAGYYGPAGAHVAAYLKVIHDAVEASRDPLGCFSAHTAKFLSFETLSAGWAHLAKAEAAVKDKRDLLQRVRVAQLPAMYAFMMRWKEMRARAKALKAPWPMAESIDEAYKRFAAVAEAAKIARLNEWQKGFGPLKQAVARAKK